MATKKKSQTARPLILIADDHRATRRLIRSVFKADGIDFLEAADGHTALEMFVTHYPHVVLLDIMMPALDGIETCARIKSLPAGSEVPILVFTGQDDGNAAERAFKAGAADFLTKPINREELRHRVRRLLYLRELEAKRRAAELRLQENLAEMQALSQKILHAYEEERIRLARELHDEVGMALTTVKLELQLLKKELSAGRPELEQRLASSIEMVNNSLAIIRHKAATMRPPALDDLGLHAVVRNMLQELGRLTGIDADLRVKGEEVKLPPEIETALYRCIQEALTNIAKHAGARTAAVELAWSPGDLSIVVADDGAGFDPAAAAAAPDRLGLQGMRERVSLLGGKMEISAMPGKGTTIKLSVPFKRC